MLAVFPFVAATYFAEIFTGLRILCLTMTFIFLLGLLLKDCRDATFVFCVPLDTTDRSCEAFVARVLRVWLAAMIFVTCCLFPPVCL